MNIGTKVSMSLLERRGTEFSDCETTSIEDGNAPDHDLELPAHSRSASEDTRLGEKMDGKLKPQSLAATGPISQKRLASPATSVASSVRSERAVKPKPSQPEPKKQRIIAESNDDDDDFDDEQENKSEKTQKKLAEPPNMSHGISQMDVLSKLTPGATKVIAEYLLNANRPINVTSIFQSFKETYTRVQVDKALASLVLKDVVKTLEDGAKVFWINQTLMQQSCSEFKKNHADFESQLVSLQRQEDDAQRRRDTLEARVKSLIVAPSDDELVKAIECEQSFVQSLEERLGKIDAFEREALKAGKSASELSAKSQSELASQKEFFTRIWRERKKNLMEFVEKVCDAKNLKGSGRRDLVESIGIDTDEACGVTLAPKTPKHDGKITWI